MTGVQTCALPICSQGITTTTVNYSCSCGKTKSETNTANSGCNWQWVGDTSYDNSGCVATTVSIYMCTTHGTSGGQPPRVETVDGHDWREERIEPTCEMEGSSTMICTKCGTHKDYTSLGGGQGHSFAETARRPLSEEEALWYGEGFMVKIGRASCRERV